MTLTLKEEKIEAVAPDELTWFDGRDVTMERQDEHREWRAARSIRVRVFVEEQNIPHSEEFDGLDGQARHLLMRRIQEGGTLDIGTARWRAIDDDGAPTAKLERFAVLPEHRGGGVGQRLVNAVLEDAKAHGFARFMLHAQEYLVDFYRVFGFLTVGKRFIEAGVPHRRMVRDDRDD